MIKYDQYSHQFLNPGIGFAVTLIGIEIEKFMEELIGFNWIELVREKAEVNPILHFMY